MRKATMQRRGDALNVTAEQLVILRSLAGEGVQATSPLAHRAFDELPPAWSEVVQGRRILTHEGRAALTWAEGGAVEFNDGSDAWKTS